MVHLVDQTRSKFGVGFPMIGNPSRIDPLTGVIPAVLETKGQRISGRSAFNIEFNNAIVVLSVSVSSSFVGYYTPQVSELPLDPVSPSWVTGGVKGKEKRGGDEIQQFRAGSQQLRLSSPSPDVEWQRNIRFLTSPFLISFRSPPSLPFPHIMGF